MAISKVIFKNFDFLAPILLFLFFSIFSLLLPSYNSVNGFYNKIFSDYNFFWADGRSPITLEIIRQIIKDGSTVFPSGYIIDNKPINLNYDFSEIDGKFYPIFFTLPHYFFTSLIIPLTPLSDLMLYKSLLSLNIFFSAFTISMFYLIQRELGLKPHLSFVSCMLTGTATSLLIYSKYLFIGDTLLTMFFITFFYLFLRLSKNINSRNKLILISTLTLSILFIPDLFGRIVALSLFLFYFYKLKIFNRKSSLIILFFIITLFSIIFSNYFYLFSFKIPFGYGEILRNDEMTPAIDKNVLIYNIPIFSIYTNYIPALDFSIFGYHNQTSAYKLVRESSYVYGFLETKGNAIFISAYNLFGPLFSERGFVYNSPFLIFSILGIWICTNKHKQLMIHTILFFLIIFGVLNFMWYGGVTPRYVRHFDIPILLLTFFSFYYIQNSKNKFLLIIFSVFAILSILNVASLSIREDWTYEHPADLVSYDLVLWPWIQPKLQGNSINLYLTNMGENVVWKYGGESDCKAYGSIEGIVTYFCRCEAPTYAERFVKVPWNRVNISFVACNKLSSSSSIIGQFYFNNASKEFTISVGSCVKEYFVTNALPENSIVLRQKFTTNCTQEIVWKSIFIEKA